MEIIKVSLDRFEGNLAVAYSDSDGRKVDLKKDLLPEGTKPGDRLVLQIEDGTVIRAIIDLEGTLGGKDRIRRKYQRLRRRRNKERTE